MIIVYFFEKNEFFIEFLYECAFCLILCSQFHHPYVFVQHLICFTLGLASGVQVVTFATISDRHKKTTMGTASGVQNMAVASSGLLNLALPFLIGWIHPDTNQQLFNHLSHHELSLILWLFAGIMLCGSIMASIWGQETYCQNKEVL